MSSKKYKSSQKRKERIANRKPIPKRAECVYCKKSFYENSKHFFNCATENNPNKSKEEITKEINDLFAVDVQIPIEIKKIETKKYFVITKSFLRIKSGPFTKKQLNLIGVDYPLEKNWIRNTVGKKIPISNKIEFEKIRPTKKKQKQKSYLESKSTSKPKKSDKTLSNEAMKVYLHLTNMKIEFSIEKYFDDCVNPKTNMKLPFDFYLPTHNTLIEYDGRQHFDYVKKYHGDDEKEGLKLLAEQQFRDKIKDEYCSNKGITLIRISYKEKSKIKTIIESNIKLHN